MMRHRSNAVAKIVYCTTLHVGNAQEFRCQIKRTATQIHQHELALDSVAGVAMFLDKSGRLWGVRIDFRNGKTLEANSKTNIIVLIAFAAIRCKLLLRNVYRPGDLLMIDKMAIYPCPSVFEVL